MKVVQAHFIFRLPDDFDMRRKLTGALEEVVLYRKLRSTVRLRGKLAARSSKLVTPMTQGEMWKMFFAELGTGLRHLSLYTVSEHDYPAPPLTAKSKRKKK